MPSLSRLSAFGCAIAIAGAKWIKNIDESETWEPAQETEGIMNLDPAGWTPKPTAAPGANLVEMELRKRAGTSTCGYYAGYSSSAAVICQGSASCILNSGDMAVGCCGSADVDDCSIPTVCVPSRSASAYTASNLDYTLLCTSSAYPNCVTYSYDRYDAQYAGYSALGCGADAATYSVEFYAPELGSALSNTGQSSSSTQTSTSTTSSTTSPSSSTTSTGTTSSSSTRIPGGQTTSPPAGSNSSSGSSTGAIVGGVVGGVGGLALIGLGIFFLVRHLKKNKNKAGSTPPPAAPAQNNVYYSPGPGPDPSLYGQSPQMGQAPQQFSGYPPAGFVAADHRTSMAPTYFSQSPKPSHYDSVSTAPVSPTGSPPPVGYTPPLAGGMQSQHQSYSPPPPQQYQSYNPQHGHASELPTGRPDALPENYATGLRLIDEAHARDPKTITSADGSGTIGYELHYAQKMTKWLAARCPDASPTLQLACRAQHFQRWEIPRSSYPMTRPGYLTWRSKQKAQAATQVAELLTSSSISPALPKEDIDRVAALIRKENLNSDEETQVLEDTACLVFLDDQFDDFEKKDELDEDKIIGILRKTWVKMSPKGQELALGMQLSDRAKGLIGKALGA
ncbi:glutamyl-tRNA synthetase-like protein [Seiridium cupressi]